MDDLESVESSYSTNSVTMSAVVACILIFSCAIVFFFAICVCCASAGSEWMDGETFLDDLLRMQICSTVQRIEDLLLQEAVIRMRLAREGQENNAQLERKLQHIVGKLEKARRRLVELRREAEEANYYRTDSYDDGSTTIFEIDRVELIEKSLIFKSAETRTGTIQDYSVCTEASTDDENPSHDCTDENCCGLECSICLNFYQEGEAIANSIRDKCVHEFHRDCILLWLRNHDHCPLCRTRIVGPSEDDDDDDDDESVVINV